MSRPRSGCYKNRMNVRATRRRAALERMADHLLGAGLSGASLRSLAAAAGTSDRMLLYYFETKDELLAATLDHIAARLARLLDEAGSNEAAKPFHALLAEVWAAVRGPALRPYMRLWLELAARRPGRRTASDDRGPHRGRIPGVGGGAAARRARSGPRTRGGVAARDGGRPRPPGRGRARGRGERRRRGRWHRPGGDGLNRARDGRTRGRPAPVGHEGAPSRAHAGAAARALRPDDHVADRLAALHRFVRLGDPLQRVRRGDRVREAPLL